MSKRKSKGTSASEKSPKNLEHVSDSSDEEIDEDEAFNSEDELKYGSLFNTKKGKSKGKKDDDEDDDNESVSSDDNGSYSVSGNESSDEDDSSTGLAGSDDDEEEGDGGQYMLDLLNNLDKGDKQNPKNKERQDAVLAMSHSALIAESEFSSAAVNSTDLTLDQLMSSITDTKGFGTVQKTMSKMESRNNKDGSSSKAITTTKAPVSRVISNRASRKVHYEEQTEDVSRWTEVVKQNREAETLDFRPKDRAIVTRDELVSKFEPTTEFEKELAEVLEKAGVSDEKEMMKQEEEALLGNEFDDDLGGNKLTMEEYKSRMGELSKMRALMFYDEQKRHHINKIKSKKYRKIRKKKRDQVTEAEQDAAIEEDPDLERELEEKEEMERMKERMTLAHKNTSKWAKRVLRRGGNIDTDTRKALSAQLRIGDDLRKKMMGAKESDESDNETERDLIDQARAVLLDTESSETKSKNKPDSLLEMAFMKKGVEAQRQRAKEEARELLAELEANENSGSDSSDSTEANESKKTDEKKIKKKVASEKETEKILSKGAFVAKSLQFGNSNAISVNGNVGIDIDFLDTNGSEKKKKLIDDNNKDKNSDDFIGAFSSTKGDLSKSFETEKKSVKRKKPITNDDKTKTNLVTNETQSNPWLQPDSENEHELSKQDKLAARKKQKTSTSLNKPSTVDVSGAVNIITSDDDGSEEKVVNNEEGKSDITDTVKDDGKLVTLSQDELVRRAFAAPTVDEIDEEFQKEKDATRERDDPSKKKKDEKDLVFGWGSWTGKGAPAPRPPKALPKHLQPPTKKPKKRPRQDDGKKNVIINEKRMKKNAKFQIDNIPYPFTSREQYERAMCGGVGYEWNVTSAVKSLTRAEVVTRNGKIIRPINKKSKAKRGPAKF